MLTLFSPAKANLYFKVLYKRPDGYHQIQTDIVMLDLFDTLTFSFHSEYDLLTCSCPNLPLDHTNLISKAIELFRLKTQQRFFVHVHLEKKIPMQAGLGGGSSNAATTLFALNQMHGSPFTNHELSEMGAFLGADVSCFFGYGKVRCEGLGEIITPLPFEEKHFWIVKPEVSLCTATVFKNLRIQEDHSLTNDLEPAAFRLAPLLKNLKQTLFDSSCSEVFMTGSGSAFVCLNKPHLIDPSLKIFETKTVSRNPSQWY